MSCSLIRNRNRARNRNRFDQALLRGSTQMAATLCGKIKFSRIAEPAKLMQRSLLLISS